KPAGDGPPAADPRGGHAAAGDRRDRHDRRIAADPGEETPLLRGEGVRGEAVARTGAVGGQVCGSTAPAAGRLVSGSTYTGYALVFHGAWGRRSRQRRHPAGARASGA